MPKKLIIVIPCYNEADCLPVTMPALDKHLSMLKERSLCAQDSFLLFVNDGSTDSTEDVLFLFCEGSVQARFLSLAVNAGHQNALLAGMDYARGKCDMMISIDADLQQDPMAMIDFIRQYEQGYDIVMGVRRTRDTDSAFKRVTAKGYYRLMRMFGVHIVPNHADYRLLSARVLDALAQYREVNLFLRGLISSMGFRSCTVEYEVSPRMQGKTKYSLSKMLDLAFSGITSFSITPLRMVTGMGFLCLLVSLGWIVYDLIAFFGGQTVSGWASLGIALWAIGGLLMISLGIVGEYIGRIYLETKNRPRYLLSQVYEGKQDDANVD